MPTALKQELPVTKDVNTCCGRKTKVSKIRVKTKMMSDPPRTTDRYVIVSHWQCMNIESHHGEVWTTSDTKDW